MKDKSIFIVEDERIIAMDLAKRLNDMGFKVEGIASSGTEAIEQITKLKPDLVIMDIVIQGEYDGIETATKLKPLNIPIVYLTAYSDQETLDRAKLTEPYGYILKPFKDKEIKTTLEVSLYKSSIEGRLKESEELYKFLYNNYPEIYLTLDSNSNIISVNEFGCLELGYSIEDLFGKPISTLVYSPDSEIISNSINKLLKNSSIENDLVEVRLLNKRNENLWTKIKIKSTFKNGEKILILVCEDISKLKLMEEKLINAQKLESLGVLAGGIAHDFNNMLTMIMSNVSLAKLKLEEKSEPKNIDSIIELLTQAEKNTFNTKQLTQQLLTFSKGGKPRKKLSSRLEKIVEDNSKIATRGTNANCSFNFSEGLWALEIDEGQIGQVINNLVINATEAMSNEGKIDINLQNIEINTDEVPELKSGKYIKISVKDEGAGIEEDNFTKVFEPYYSTKQGSNGLGLSVTYSIIKNHDGHIEVNSEIEKGTEFVIYLPSIGAIHTPEDVDQQSKAVAGSGKILFMDDEEQIRNIADKILSKLGYDVTCVSEGKELLNVYDEHNDKNNNFDLVIMDLIVKNGLGGLETIKLLLEKHPNAKAIVSSGYSNESLMSEYQKYGFVECIMKPYTVKEFSSKINSVLTN